MRDCACCSALRYVLKLAIELIDDVAACALGGVPLLFGKRQFFGKAFAHRVCARFGFARVIFHALEDGSRLVHEVERGGAVILAGGGSQADNIFRLSGGTLVPIVPDIVTELLICA